MVREGLDLSELEAFADELERASRRAPRHTKKFLQTQGNKLRKQTKARAMSVVGKGHKKPEKYKDSPHYVDTIKRGKPYNFLRSDVMAIRVYSSAPHAHLIEKGHKVISHGKFVKFYHGEHIFEKTRLQFKPQFEAACEEFLDEVAREVED